MVQFFERNNQSVRSPIAVGWVDVGNPIFTLLQHQHQMSRSRLFCSGAVFAINHAIALSRVVGISDDSR
ncbi:MAG: hypothetical protein RID09_19150 [Coleofasciculus sp. G1-WW12-02]|uniref:hypothetical protein n=1 Tax=Coleofasciculus sp. G1-WW12-02 TaxID=3068483 RepID=UPI0032F12199